MKRAFDPDRILRDLLASGRDGEHFDMRIDSRGQWFHEGRRIERIELVRLFSTILRKADDGSYWLVTPVEQGRIEVEDVPFVLLELALEGETGCNGQIIRLRSNTDEWVTIDDRYPLVMRERSHGGGLAPYVTIRDRLEGRVARAVFYEMADMAVEHEGEIGVWSCGTFHVLGAR
ncbi:MAG: DUF1285 domain-containing protein [Geminicoccaceae bacterium]|nr:DUF1285 domain-containing protein [Geminicoccaceae bacterium]